MTRLEKELESKAARQLRKEILKLRRAVRQLQQILDPRGSLDGMPLIVERFYRIDGEPLCYLGHVNGFPVFRTELGVVISPGSESRFFGPFETFEEAKEGRPKLRLVSASAEPSQSPVHLQADKLKG